MFSFWLTLFTLLIIWFLALLDRVEAITDHPMLMLVSAVFFSIYFILPLLKNHARVYLCAFIFLIFISSIVLWPTEMHEINGFSFVLQLFFAQQIADRFTGKQAVWISLILYLSAILPYLLNASLSPFLVISLFALMIGFILIDGNRIKQQAEQLKQNYNHLQSEFRKVKRQVVNNDQVVRQAERQQIARDMHDSVGHHLTALMMQLEVARMQAHDDQQQKKLAALKALAQKSLNQTREAVQTLKRDETRGLAAVIHLLRQLEAESHVRITFSVNPGALTAPLTNNQSVAVYRAVQEALTNMMRHSHSRQATIVFATPAKRYFSFEVSHPVKEYINVEEGFGLTSMRERIEQVGGQLKIHQVEQTFKIMGMFPLREEEWDSE